MNEHFSSLFGQIEDKPTKNNVVFGVLSGNFPKSGIAIPLSSKKVFYHVLDQLILYKGKSLYQKLKIQIVKYLSFGFVGKIIFKKKFYLKTEGQENVFSFIKSKLGEEIIFSIYVGSRKFILPIFRLRDGVLLGYAKVYYPGGESAYFGENEAIVLKKLENVNLKTAKTPKVISDSYFGRFLVVIISSFENLNNFPSPQIEHIEFLKELSRETGEIKTFEESEFLRSIKEEYSFIKSVAKEKSIFIQRVFDFAIEGLIGKKFTFSLTMREFPYFQMMKDSNGNFVIDWEHARFGFPPIFDFYSLMLSGAEQHGNSDFVIDYERKIRETFFSNNKKTISFATDIFRSLNIHQNDAYSFFLLFLIDQLFIHLKSGDDVLRTRIIPLLEKISQDEEYFKKTWNTKPQ